MSNNTNGNEQQIDFSQICDQQLLLQEALLIENVRWSEEAGDPLEATHYRKQLAAVLGEEKKRDKRNELPPLLDGFQEIFDDFYDRGEKERKKLEAMFKPNMSAPELLNQESTEPISYVWDDYLATGILALLCAFMKCGKTTFAYRMGISIAQGREFLGRKTAKGGVLVLAVEEHKRDIQNRCRRFGLKETDPFHVHVDHTFKNTPENIEAVKQFIVQNQIILLIIDSLSMFWNVQNENDNAEVIREMTPLLGIARTTNATVMPIHHERKSGGEDGRSIRGGGSLFGIVDQALFLERQPGEVSNRRILKTLGRYDSPPELIIELHENDYHSLGTPEELSEAARVEKVEAVLTDKFETVETIMEKTNLKRKPCDKALKTLVDDSRAEQTGGGYRGNPYLYRRMADSFLLPKGGNGKETNLTENPKNLGNTDNDSFLFRSFPMGKEKKETNPGITPKDALRVSGGKLVEP
jgi:hypothetical protein